jgi:hypothetical protein
VNYEQHGQPWWRSPIGIVAIGFGLIAAFFLVTEHAAHLFGVLPWLLLLTCPLMHIFMHHGHGGDGHPGRSTRERETDR